MLMPKSLSFQLYDEEDDERLEKYQSSANTRKQQSGYNARFCQYTNDKHNEEFLHKRAQT